MIDSAGLQPRYSCIEGTKDMKPEPKRIGRPPITEGDPREKKSITIRRSTWEALEWKRHPGESLSACIDRLLSRRK